MSEPGSLIRSLSGRMTARNFHSHVINEIGVGIISGKYPIGTTLPNDADMMMQFNVSRTVLREALKTLESKGLVEARPKIGTRVSARSRWNHFDWQVLAWHYIAGPDESFWANLNEVRMSLEPVAAAKAAENRTADDVRMMQYWIQQMENSVDSAQNFALADFELHRAIADATISPFMRSISGVIELAHAAIYEKVVAAPSKSLIDGQLISHGKLVSAIESGNSASASNQMKAIIKFESKSS